MGIGGDPRAPRLRASIGSCAAGRHADTAGGGPRGRSSAFCGATDAPRDVDIRSRRDCPQRPSYWAVASFCARPWMLSCAAVYGNVQCCSWIFEPS